MSHELSRRQVLKLVSYASAGTAVGSVPLISRFFVEKANAQTATFVRENIYTFMQSPAKVAALRRGVQVMKSRPANNPTSWAYQANIHGTTIRPLLASWNTCDHGTFFFFPWHRMYLYYFERILRQASGDSTLALPYWNYSDVGAQRVLPAPFRIPANESTNSLYESDRTGNINVNSGAALPATIVGYASAFRRTNFFHTTTGSSFGGRRVSQTSHTASGKGELERRPHDQVHASIGGLMGNPITAAQDPIFWLHHANTDRLWERWLRQGGGRVNPTDDIDWMNDTFTFFDENRNAVRMSARNILDTATQLNYIYDDPLTRSSNAVALSPNADINSQRTVASTPEEVAVSANGQEVTFVLGDTPLTLTAQAQNLLARTVLVEDSTVTLNVIEVEYDAENPLAYDIYINLPQGVAPNPNSPYYAGILSLFSLHQQGTFSLDITDVVSELQRRNLIAGNSIAITFVPPQEKQRNRRRRGRPNQVQQAVRFSGVTITRE
ncbi:tyrosinase family protein [Aliterella atlantica]|uniref:Catechol oxidase n=1 Tax=Aliterella atlantica CENA595 TaxID=1618023 RepID=A0A0D8ZXF6_9CYAN|nr:tyrosinase family protein [Aliterella atlantica]KJH73445.1 catechol oxidase [Aliterella atlantica CENA595]